VRALRPSGRFPLIVASLAAVAAVAWPAWRWSEPHHVAAHRSAAPHADAPQTGTLPADGPAGARPGPRELATPRAEDPGEARQRRPDTAARNDRLERTASAAPDDRRSPAAGGSIVAIDPETYLSRARVDGLSEGARLVMWR